MAQRVVSFTVSLPSESVRPCCRQSVPALLPLFARSFSLGFRMRYSFTKIGTITRSINSFKSGSMPIRFLTCLPNWSAVAIALRGCLFPYPLVICPLPSFLFLIGFHCAADDDANLRVNQCKGVKV